MIYEVFMTKRINMPMSLLGTKHMYNVTTRLHMMFYVMLCLDVHVYLYSTKVLETCMRV
jgi:hypothetical protein